MRQIIYSALVGVVMLVGLGATVVWAEGGGRVKAGYVFVDEVGNLGVNQETYNLYDGPALSLEDFQYRAANGVNVTADLTRITLNNRNLRASVSKPGLFGLSVSNHQYRRIYSFDGDRFTRRRSTAGEAYVHPIKEVKIFGGYALDEKYGQSRYVVRPYGESVYGSTDYSHTSFHVGGQATYRQGNLRLEYRRFDFTDDTKAAGDRQADQFTIDAFAPVPKYQKLVLSGGYQYRKDRHVPSAVELKTNQGWAAARVYLPRDFIAEYRFVAARSDHTLRPVEIDNFVNTASVSRTWPKYGGLRLGYEYRSCDDILNRTVAQGFLFAGWFRYHDRLTLRARLALRRENVIDGATLVGDEDLTRHEISARYQITAWGDLLVRYQGRIKKNDDIGARADYNAVTAELNLARTSYGRLSVTYSYYQGEYDNRTGADPGRYEFGDHVLTGAVHTVEYRNLQVWAGGSYYRAKRDRDTEKIGGRVGGQYQLPRGYRVEAEYQVMNYDDYLVIDEYYTGNIVMVNLIKSFTL